jgi:hypothetical protein
VIAVVGGVTVPGKLATERVGTLFCVGETIGA